MLSKRYAYADSGRCVSCGVCTKVCPMNAISIFKGCFAVVKEELCIGCGKCQKICPADCITIKERGAL